MRTRSRPSTCVPRGRGLIVPALRPFTPTTQRAFRPVQQPQPLSRFARYAWSVLAWNVGVVLWGAFVRASGSGAGCGNHWPACNGQVIPQSPSVHTLIELTHRVMTGVDTPLVIALAWLAWRLYAKGSPVRRAAAASLFFLVTEALVGAALVKLDLVADNRSGARVWMMALHLVNTFLLLGSLTLMAWLAQGRAAPRLRGQGALAWVMLGAVVATIAVGTTGAITALGDTLYPKAHVGIEVAAAATFLERLRIVHPIVAVATALYVMLAGVIARRMRPTEETAALSRRLVALFVAQIMAGVFNVAMLAPVWMQLVHLLLADAVWIVLVCTAASALAPAESLVAASSPRPELAPSAG
jgi:heme A synthase